ncbi:hypothetical protein E2542_SST21056 [Spatholobus suberectus]|nr:hypothetical protein E2542_SST21056 [Spatholobus suberectus]
MENFSVNGEGKERDKEKERGRGTERRRENRESRIKLEKRRKKINSQPSILKLSHLTVHKRFPTMGHVNADTENRTEPRRNVNLTPFESWRSAYFCLLNTSSNCLSKGYTLALDGVLNVKDSEIKDFCNGGCYYHTLAVLSCIEDVKRDFYFGTKQPVSFVENATKNACASQLYGNKFNT